MENSIAAKRELMEISRRLIPMMDEREINTLALTMQAIIDNMIKRGIAVTEE